jgi:hypothetical protein
MSCFPVLFGRQPDAVDVSNIDTIAAFLSTLFPAHYAIVKSADDARVMRRTTCDRHDTDDAILMISRWQIG